MIEILIICEVKSRQRRNSTQHKISAKRRIFKIAKRMPRYNKLQLQIFSLYRQFLRVARKKPGTAAYIKDEFHRNASIPKMETLRIEHLLRKGQRQLELFKRSTTVGVGIFHPDQDGERRKK